LKLEQSSLLQDIDHTQQLALQQVSDSRFQQAMLNGQLEQLADQIKIESAQMGMAQKLVNTWRPLLAKGYISTLQFEQEQSTVWGYESQYRALLQQQYGARQQLNVLNDQQLQIPLATSVKLNVLRRQLAQVDENLSQNETILQQALYMPSDGSVKSVIAKADNRMTGEQSSQAGEANSQQTATTRLISDKPVAGMHRDNPGGAHFQTINAQSANSFNSGHHSVSAHNV
jgi:membrane fusion protein